MVPWREQLESNQKLRAFAVHVAPLTDKTKESYYERIKEICDFFKIDYDKFDPNLLNQEVYDEFIMKRSKELKRSTLNLYSRIFRILMHLYSFDIKIRIVKETDKFTDHVTYEEIQKIMIEADKETAAICAFLFFTGLRPVSLLSLTKDQLILNAENPFLRAVRMKGGRREDIPILNPEIVIPLLRWYMQFKATKNHDYNETNKIFVSNRTTGNYEYLRYCVRKCSEILGRRVYPRMFRKGLGVWLGQIGLQDENRRIMLGHTNSKTTNMFYSKFSINDVFKEFNERTGKNVIEEKNHSEMGILSTREIPKVEKCPFCNREVNPRMTLCPWCEKVIRRICSVCKEFLDVRWKKCPYCQNEIEKTYSWAK